MVGSPPSHATINAFTFPTIGNDNTTRAISSIPNMHQNNVMNMQNNHSPREDPNDSKANDSIPFLPDDEALFLNISLDDPTPQAKGSAQWKWVPSKSAKKKSKGSPSALPTAAIGKNVTMKQPHSPTTSFGSLLHMDSSAPSTPPQKSVVTRVRIPLPTLHHTSLDTPLANGAHKAARNTNKEQQQLCFPTILHPLGKAASTAKQQLLEINKAMVGTDPDIPSTAKTNQTNRQQEQTNQINFMDTTDTASEDKCKPRQKEYLTYYLDFRITQDHHFTDETIMTIVRATLKALLKSTPKMKILPQEQAEDMPIISRFNGTLPQAIDTWEIRKNVHKGNMNVSNFFGILKIQRKSMDEILQSLTVKKLLAKYPSLTVTESFFGLNQTVIAGALYGSLAHEYCKLLTNHISNKQKGHIHGRIIK